MGLFGGKPDVNKLVSKRDIEGLIKALQTGIKKGEPSTNYEDAIIRTSAAKALGIIGDAKTLEMLLSVEHEDIDVRKILYFESFPAIVKREGPNVVQLLLNILMKCHYSTRPVIIDLIRLTRDKRAVAPLINILKGPVEGIVFTPPIKIGGSDKTAAVTALGEIGDPSAIDSLFELVVNPQVDMELRREAAIALGKIGPPAIESLIVALTQRGAEARRIAAEALGITKDSRAIEPLISVLADKHLDIRTRAAHALWEITGQKFGEATEKWREWWGQHKSEMPATGR